MFAAIDLCDRLRPLYNSLLPNRNTLRRLSGGSSMSIFRIEIKAGQPATYNPSTQTVVVNDSVFWFNSDPTQAHFPTPDVGTIPWLQFQVAPNSPSAQVAFGVPGTFKYHCANHTGESGTIVVKSRKKKGAFGKKTKKGGFGASTTKGSFGSGTKKGAFGSTTKKY
jgi:plastocyanin